MDSMIDVDRALLLRNSISSAHVDYSEGKRAHELPANILIDWWETNCQHQAHVFGSKEGDAYAITWLAYAYNHDIQPALEVLNYFTETQRAMDYLYVDEHTLTHYFFGSQQFREIFCLPISPFIHDNDVLMDRFTSLGQSINSVIKPPAIFGAVMLDGFLDRSKLHSHDHRVSGFSSVHRAVLANAIRHLTEYDQDCIDKRLNFVANETGAASNNFMMVNALLCALPIPIDEYHSLTAKEYLSTLYFIASNPRNKGFKDVIRHLASLPSSIKPILADTHNPYAVWLYECAYERGEYHHLALTKHNMLIHAPLEDVICAPLTSEMLEVYLSLTGYSPSDLLVEQAHADTQRVLVQMMGS